MTKKTETQIPETQIPETQITETQIPMTLSDLVASVPTDDKLLKSMAGGTSFLPRLQLCWSRTQKVDQGEFPKNHYALITFDDYKDVEEKVKIIPILYRPMALDTSDPKSPVFTYDIECELFKDIRERSSMSDSGCMFGPQYLVYLPDYQQFATLFLGSASAKNLVEIIEANRGKLLVLGHKYVSKVKHPFECMTVEKSNATYDAPDMEKARDVIVDFQNPKESELEVATEEEGRER